MNQDLYIPQYSASHALIVGINDYQHASPLSYAINDAKGTSQILIDDFGFSKDNITLLTDSDATRAGIIDSFLEYRNKTGANDRILFFLLDMAILC